MHAPPSPPLPPSKTVLVLSSLGHSTLPDPDSISSFAKTPFPAPETLRRALSLIPHRSGRRRGVSGVVTRRRERYEDGSEMLIHPISKETMIRLEGWDVLDGVKSKENNE